MEEEIDPYERQLLAVFKSCDGSGCGVLDEDGFHQLCDALQLEEIHRNLLTTRLCFDNKCHVEFPQFRDALLAVLASLKSPTSDCDDQTSFCEEIGKYFIVFFPMLFAFLSSWIKGWQLEIFTSSVIMICARIKDSFKNDFHQLTAECIKMFVSSKL